MCTFQMCTVSFCSNRYEILDKLSNDLNKVLKWFMKLNLVIDMTFNETVKSILNVIDRYISRFC